MPVPELDLTDPELIRDPFTAYGRVREIAPVARMPMPGIGTIWVLLRHETARAMLGDPRFAITSGSFLTPPGVPEDCLPYLRTMSEMDGPDHLRVRRLAAPAFRARRVAGLVARIARLAERLLDELPEPAADLLPGFARPLPIEVICELVGVPEDERPRWREYGAVIASGSGQRLGEAMPGIVAGARALIARRRDEPADDLMTDLLRAGEDADRLTETELVTMVWHLVLAGQTPVNLIANAIEVLLRHDLRIEPAAMARAVEELLRWCGPALLSVPRYAQEDVELEGVLMRKGEAVTVSAAAANRDPRVFAEADRLDLGRLPGPHLGFGHGPHFCLGAGIARVQTEVALTTLFRRFPGMTLVDAPRAMDPGTWRLEALTVRTG